MKNQRWYLLIGFLVILSFSRTRGDSKFQLGNACEIEYSYPRSADEIQIRLRCYSQGFISLGFGSQMTGSDIIVCNKTETSFSVYDMYGVGDSAPLMDAQQDVSLVQAQRTSEFTECVFRRLLVTSDKTNDLPIFPNKPTGLIYAYGASDSLSYHGSSRGSSTVTFRAPQKISLGPNCTLGYIFPNRTAIQFTFGCTNQGYIAMGFNSSSMFNADIIVCSKNADGDFSALDMYSVGEKPPQTDAQQDVKLLYSERTAEHTLCSMERKLNTGDPFDAVLKANEYLPIIWAFGAQDGMEYHEQNKGSLTGIFFDPDDDSQDTGTEVVLDQNCSFTYNLLDTKRIRITLTCLNQGYISLGIGNAMKDSDIILCRKSGDSFVVYDMYGTGHNPPINDTSQDVKLIIGMRSDTHTTCTFERDLNTGDSQDLPITPGSAMSFLFAYGQTDDVTYHKESRGVVTVTIKSFRFIALGANCTLGYLLPNPTYIQMIQRCNNKGFIGVGFGSKGMSKADIIICSKENTPNLRVTDMWDSNLTNDTQQDVSLLRSTEGNNFTECSYLRKLDTGDRANDVILKVNTEIDVIWAYSVNNYSLTYHSINRGNIKAVFQTEEADDLIGTKVFLSDACQLIYSILDRENIRILMKCFNQGYISFGLGTGMNKADIIMCNKTGETFSVYDYHGTPAPVLDNHQDTTLISARRTPEFTQCVFQRKLSTQDVDDVDIVLGTSNSVIFAFGVNDSFIYHAKNRGVSAITIKNFTTFSLGPNCTLGYLLPNKDYIQMIQRCNNTGYVAIGLGSTGMMNADIIVCSKQNTSNLIVSDMWSSDLLNDTQQDVTLLSSSDSQSYTECSYLRKLDTGDRSNDVVITPRQEISLIWAYGLNNYSLTYHQSQRGTLNTVFYYDSEDDLVGTKVDLGKGCYFIYSILDRENIKFLLKCLSQGYISLGVGNSMLGSDMIMCNSTNDKFSAYNYYGTPAPELKPSPEFTFISGKRDANYTQCLFQRKLAKTSNESLEIILGQPNDFIFSFGQNDSFVYHKDNRGAVNVIIKNYTTFAMGPNCTLGYLFPNTDYIQFIQKCHTSGYLGLGIGSSVMGNADYIICSKEKTQNLIITDMWDKHLKNETQQDVKLLSSKAEDNLTECSFIRRLDTGDRQNDVAITPNKDINLIWAYSLNNYSLSYHNSTRGTLKAAFVLSDDDELIGTKVLLDENFYLIYSLVDRNSIRFLVRANNQGYISLGIGKEMNNSDMIMCNKTGDIFTVYDYHGTPKPVLDPFQNVKLISGRRTSNYTQCIFERDLKTGDVHDKNIDVGSFMDFIFAYGATDNFSYHAGRGAANIYIKNFTTFPMGPNCTLGYILPNDDYIQLIQRCQNKGYIGVGFGSKGMHNSDMIICSKVNTDYLMVSDMWGTHMVNDTQQDVKLLSSKADNTFTECSYLRRLDTGDRMYDFVITPYEDIDIVWGYSADNYTLGYHNSSRGTISNVFVDNYQEEELIGIKIALGENCYFVYALVNQTNIRILLKCNNQGYIALGLGTGMKGADMIVCNQTNETFKVYDYYGSPAPTLDAQQDVTLLSARRTSKYTQCIFERKLNTSDPQDTAIVPGKTNNFIYAYGNNDSFVYHNQSRGFASNLIRNFSSANIGQACSLHYLFLDNYYINFLLRCNTKGYLALGFEYFNSSDLITCSSVQDQPNISVSDMWGENPFNDTQQDVTLMASTKGDDFTECSFVRRLDTGDRQDDQIILPNKVLTVLVDYGNDNYTLGYPGPNLSVHNVSFDNGEIDFIGSQVTLDSNCSFLYNYPNENTIQFSLTCKSQGYISLGLGVSMNNSDIFFCNMTNNKFNVVDMYGVGDTYPLVDKIQNLNFVSGSRTKEETNCIFWRQLDTGDKNQDLVIKIGEKVPMIYAYGTSDAFVYHKCSRGVSSTHFLNFTRVELNSDCNLQYLFPNDQYIQFILTCKNQGYISLGFGTQMKDSDMIVCNNTNGVFDVYDTHCMGHSSPILDDHQDVTFFSAKRNCTYTSCSFARKFVTGDPQDKDIIVNGNNDIIFAYGANDNMTYHGTNRGYMKIFLANTTSPCDPSCKSCSGPDDDDCTSCFSPAVISRGRCIQNNLSEPSSYSRILGDDFVFYFDFSDNLVTMMLKVKTSGWFGIGFGKDMFNVDMISASIGPNDEVQLSDSFSFDESAPRLDIALGGTEDIKVLGYSYENNVRQVKFSRKINTNDKYDTVLNPNNNMYLVWGKGDSRTISFHGKDCGVVTIDFTQGAKKDAVADNSSEKWLKAHEVILIVGWGFLTDISIIFARYFRSLNFYLNIHALIFIVVDLSTIVILTAFIIREKSKLNEITQMTDEAEVLNAHLILGLIIFALLFFQHLGGVLIKYKFLENKNGGPSLFTVKKFHMYMGYLIYLIGKANILVGYKTSGEKDDYMWGYFAYFMALFVIKLVVEIIYKLEIKAWFQQRRKIIASSKMSLMWGNLIDELNKGVSTEELMGEYPNLNWVLFNNSVYDVTDLNHPGGKFIIEAVKGREIGRFLYGAYGLEGVKMNSYKHTIYAMNSLEKRYIGHINDSAYNILTLKDGTYPIGEKESLLRGYASDNWTLESKIMVSPTTGMFVFSSSKFNVLTNMKGVNWFGRHFTVAAAGRDDLPTRLYTTVLSLIPLNIEKRKKMLREFENKVGESNNDLSLSVNQIKKVEGSVYKSQDFNKLCLFIKQYRGRYALSDFLHNMDHKEFEISGPIGRGLELNHKSDGIHYIFAGGTGILPFLDLLDFLLRKSIAESTRKSQSDLQVSDVIDFDKSGENYVGIFGKNFKVVLFGAFLNINEFLGLDIVKPLYRINKKHNLNLFDMMIRFSDPKSTLEGLENIVTNDMFDQEFINSRVQPQNVSKVWICGPPGMNYAIPNALQSLGVSKSKICIV